MMKFVKKTLARCAKPFLNEDVNSDDFKKPIFTWGCPRSGTPLMQHLLSLSPEILTTKRKKLSLDGYLTLEGTKIWWDVFGVKRGKLDSNIKPWHIEHIKKRYIYELDLKIIVRDFSIKCCL